jgi:NTE family protein
MLGKLEEILEFFKSIYLFMETFNLKKAGLIDSESFKPYFHTIFKDATLADLKIPFTLLQLIW